MPFFRGDTHNPHTKLDDCQCAKMILRRRNGEKNQTIANDNDVSKGLVSSLYHGRYRPHLQIDTEKYVEENCMG